MIREFLLDQLSRRAEEHSGLATRIFQQLTDQELLAPAPDGGWSIAQCLEHLNSYGRYYLPVLEAVVQKGKANTCDGYFKPGWLGDYFTRLMEPGTAGKLKKKMNAPANHRPVADLDAVAVVACFLQQQEQLILLLKKARRIDLEKNRVPISISRLVRLKTGDVFRFLSAHHERHLQQALRILPARISKAA